jgi:hypothetical protein
MRVDERGLPGIRQDQVFVVDSLLRWLTPSRWLIGMGGGVEGSELGADLVGVGVVEVVEDGQGLLPGVASGLGVAGGVVGVAKAGEGFGLGEGTQFTVPAQGLTERLVDSVRRPPAS